jgi:hypothetical protein
MTLHPAAGTGADENAELRKRLALDRPVLTRQLADRLSREVALAEIRRYAGLYPAAAPEIIAVELVRIVDSWDEVSAIRSALAAILRERDAARDGTAAAS